VLYAAFVDMSGGSCDDVVLAIAHRDADSRVVLGRIIDQRQRPPFDPRWAVERFAAILREYQLSTVTGDRYAGETFKADFERQGIRYVVSGQTKSQLYEALEPVLNGRRVILVDTPKLEQQFLGLIWRGGKIDHQPGEHDDFANACAGVVARAVRAERDARAAAFASACIRA